MLTQPDNIDKKLAIVTGASGGIGEKCAYSLAENGYSVLLIARREGRLEAIAKAIQARTNVECYVLACDLTSKESADLVANKISSIGMPLHVLVNNAGGSAKMADLEHLDLDDWFTVFNLNLFSIVNLTTTLIPLINAGGFGRIINISSINARVPGYFNPHYSASKAALNNFTKHLANRLADKDITVNTVSPGIIETEGWHEQMIRIADETNQSIHSVTEIERQKASSRVPLGRLGRAQDVAALVVFLSSPGAGYITGSDLVVDGGKRTEF